LLGKAAAKEEGRRLCNRGGKMRKTVEAGGILVLAREKEKRARWCFG
jgi:hypothetical protein